MMQKTKNYALFHRNPHQRKYNELKEAVLVEKMSRFGFPESMCISTYKEGGKLYINTGHHRVKAAQALGLPVWYVVEHKWDTKALISEGTSTTNWSSGDVVHTWALNGKKDYETLLNYVGKGIPLNFAASLLRGEHAASGNALAAIKSGEFKIKTTDHIDKIVMTIKDLGVRFPEAKSRSFISALSALLIVPGFQLDRLISRMRSVNALEKTANREQMLDQLEEIYNWRQKERDNLAFKAREILKQRNLGGLKNQPKAA